MRSKSEFGDDLKWEVSQNRLNFHIYSNTSTNFTTSLLTKNDSDNIILESVHSWNENSPFVLTPYIVTTNFSYADTSKEATISFSQNNSYFGPGILAVTKINYSRSSRSILSGNIIINDSNFSSNSFSKNKIDTLVGNKIFLGDVVSHEIGHLLGLAHTESPYSSMNFSVFRGQHKISDDEKIAINDIYVAKNTNITGRVVAGDNEGVFGANVLLLSQKKGKVITNQITNETGYFEFSNIDKSDSYHLAIMPLQKKDSLPPYFHSSISKYCKGAYLPSVFSKCGARSKNRAESINFNLHNLNYYNLGNITIRCNQPFSLEYFSSKLEAEETKLSFIDPFRKSPLETYIGHMTKEDVLNKKDDIFKIDLRDYLPQLGDQLKLTLFSESLFSKINYKIRIKNLHSGALIYDSLAATTNGKYNLDREIIIPLSTTNAENEFEVSLKPMSQVENHFGSLGGTFNEDLYLLTSSIISSNGEVYSPDSYPYDDNKNCNEGSLPYKTTPNITSQNDTVQNTPEKLPVSCASVNMGGEDGGKNTFSFVIGVLFVLIFSKLKKPLSKILSK